jgi:hypothetical protein
MRRYLSKKQIAEIRESFNKAFNAMIERRDKAEKVFCKKHHLKQPTAKQLASFSRLVQEMESCRDWDRIAWFYPLDAYNIKTTDGKKDDSVSTHKFVYPTNNETKTQKRKMHSKKTRKAQQSDGQE